jgi:hypothetical protein
LAVLLLSGSAGLGYVLSHDAVGADPAALAASPVGDTGVVKGSFAPYLAPPAAADARWDPVHAALGNFTYVLEGAGRGMDGVVLLVTGAQSHVDTADAVVRGEVLLRIPHPDGSSRTLVVLRAVAWTHPLVFR